MHLRHALVCGLLVASCTAPAPAPQTPALVASAPLPPVSAAPPPPTPARVTWRDEVLAACGSELECLKEPAGPLPEHLLSTLEQRCGGRGLVVAIEQPDLPFRRRQLLFEHLRKLADPNAADALAEYLSSRPAPHWAAEAAFALAEVGDLRAVPFLADRLLHDPATLYGKSADPDEQALARDDRERIVAARLLTDLVNIHPQQRDAIRSQCERATAAWSVETPAPHANAMRLLAAVQSPRALPRLRSWAFPLLTLPRTGQQPPFPSEWAVAQPALRYLGAMRDEPSWGQLAAQLERRKTDAGDIDISLAALMSGGRAMVGMALRAVSVGASDGMAEWGDPRAYPLLVRHAEDPKNNDDARMEACLAIPWVMRQDQAPSLAARVKKAASSRAARDHFTATCFARALSRRSFPAAEPVLIDLMSPAVPEAVRTHLAFALGRAGLTDAEASRLRTASKGSIEAAMAIAMGGSESAARDALGSLGEEELSRIRASLRAGLTFMSEEDIDGLLPRLERNAAISGLGSVMETAPYDQGPHSLTAVVLRHRLRSKGDEVSGRVLRYLWPEARP